MSSNETPAYDFESGPLAAKAKELREKLGIKEGSPDTPRQEYSEEKPITGKDVDWGDYDLDPHFAHLYPRAELVETKQGGVEWVVLVDEYEGMSKAYYAEGKHEKSGEPKKLTEFMTWMVNGNEGWKVITILPNGTGSGVAIFHRKMPVRLPDPKLIEKETKVEAPTDEELKAIENKGAAWAGVNPESTESTEQEPGAPSEGGEKVDNLSE